MDAVKQALYDQWKKADEALNEAIHAGDAEEIASASKKLQEARRPMSPYQDDN